MNRAAQVPYLNTWSGREQANNRVADNYQYIRFQVDDRVARVTFARPPVNIFNIAMMREINDALNQCARQRDLAAIVFAA
ncbi:MAG TPA: hypothetical protein VGC61_07410, partial [Pyrinomonadaceae bacterium]